MLFEPTYVIPDLRNGLGSGVIDAADPFSVSWRVNGQPYMAAFRIVIYTNDAASTQVFDTGRLTDGCPFYGMDAEGNPQFFLYKRAAIDALENGKEYKIVITQWWNDTDSVTQSSASAFLTRDTPGVDLDLIKTVDGKSHTFRGTYTQAQGDSMNWVRWQIRRKDGTILTDTGEISGAEKLEFTYDGFIPSDEEYSIKLTVQTQNGVEADSGWIYFNVSYEMGETSGFIMATKTCPGGGVLLNWSPLRYIGGVGSGAFQVKDGTLVLGSESSVRWDTVDGGQMNFSAPWSVIWRGKLVSGERAILLTIYPDQASGGNTTAQLSVIYVAEEDKIKVFFDENMTLGEINGPFDFDPDVTLIITKDTVYYRINRSVITALFPGKGLPPADDLAPADVLVPLNGVLPSKRLFPQRKTYTSTVVGQINVRYKQKDIGAVVVAGPATVYYVEVMSGEPGNDTAQAAMDGQYEPAFGDSDYMVANFESGINAGNYEAGNEKVSGYAVYRREGDALTLKFIASVPLGVSEITDYGMSNMSEDETWYLYPITESNTYLAPMVSNKVTPCWWDWIILEGSVREKRNSRLTVYNILGVYRFGKNLSSGSMSNGNEPSIRNNFTRFPTVQKSHVNYQRGTLTSMIGQIDENGIYSDTLELRDAIYALSTTQNHLFLKNRKGDVFPIAISGEITMTTMDNTRAQAQTASIPWVQTGSGENVSLVGIEEE